jgi:uncharacterized repeat protein (TIGR01451 family)
MRHLSLMLAGSVLGVLLLWCGVASAGTPSAAWSIESHPTPTVFGPDKNSECESASRAQTTLICDTYTVTATNIGSEPTNTSTVIVADELPPGVTVRSVTLAIERRGVIGGQDVDGEVLNLSEVLEEMGLHVCTATPVRCELTHAVLTQLKNHGLLASSSVTTDEALKMYVSVIVGESASNGVVNTARVSGGIEETKEVGAPPSEVAVTRTNPLQGTAPFGADVFDADLVGTNGLASTQAGGHGYELHTVFGLDTVKREGPEGSAEASASVQDLRDVVVDLPVGLAGSALLAPQCPMAQLASRGPKEEEARSGCPADTAVGTVRTYPESLSAAGGSIYNLVPEHGVVAEFGFIDFTGGTHVLYISLVPTPGGYVVRTSSREIPAIPLNEILVNIFGDPAARDQSSEAPVAAFTNPELCSGEPLRTTVHMDSWQHPGSYNPDGTPNFEDPGWASAVYESPPVVGCAGLKRLFEPSVAMSTSSPSGDSPTGLEVDVSVPQRTGAEELAVPPLRDTTITLPAGLSVNPSSANGLEACGLEQVGISSTGVPDAAPPACPDASKLGTVELETPALPMQVCAQSNVPVGECPAGEVEHAPLTGSIYLARQTENPFGSLIAIYIVVDDPRTGVVVKIPAKVTLNEATGQLTTTVSDTPQFPFSILRTHFFEGDTAALRTPATCGTYTLMSVLTPWSAPESGPPATPSASFGVTSGPGGGACAHTPGELPNAPSFHAGTEAPTAGGYSPLVVHLDRGDGSQEFSRINVTLPPGVTGKLAGIPECSDAQIAAAEARGGLGGGGAEAASPSCPSTSQVGTVTAGAGAGPQPFYVSGHAYLAGPYKGAPFSLAIITPAVAGPFDLGVVVVRAALYINPATAQVTTKADALPSALHGIPLDIRSVTVDVNRPGFILNPTNCAPLTATGEETSTIGQTAQLSQRFQVGGCQGLAFKPSFTVATAGKTSKASGASLTVRVAYPAGSLGSETNLGRVDVQLPKQLPARLTTLQKACTEGQFNTNPAGCPVASMIGVAKAVTPLLSSPLVGPAILVSHGGAAFPDVEFLLQGEGVEVVLDGKTQIKDGITYSRFETVPDQPVSSFETTFPEGPYSVLSTDLPTSAKNSLCGQTLTMPTVLTAQDGAVINQTTKATVTGCPKVKPKALTRAQKLARALKACKRDRSRKKRAACVRQARKRYGPQARKRTKPKAKAKK